MSMSSDIHWWLIYPVASFDHVQNFPTDTIHMVVICFIWNLCVLYTFYMELKGHNAMTLVRLEPVAIQSQVKHSTTKPLRSLCVLYVSGEYLVMYGDPIRRLDY